MKGSRKNGCLGGDPGNSTPGATPCAPCYIPHPMHVPFWATPIALGGPLNMDIGPGHLNMDIGNPDMHGYYYHYHYHSPERIHVVIGCDTIHSIAKLYNIDEQTIMHANCLCHTNLYRGQRLVIPGGICY